MVELESGDKSWPRVVGERASARALVKVFFEVLAQPRARIIYNNNADFFSPIGSFDIDRDDRKRRRAPQLLASVVAYLYA